MSEVLVVEIAVEGQEEGHGPNLTVEVPVVRPEMVEDAVRKGRPIGAGTYGACYLCQDGQGTQLCVKVFHSRGRDESELQASVVEEAIRILVVKDVPGMIRLRGISLHPRPVVVTEYAGRPLMDLLRAPLPEADALQIMAQFVRIVAELTEAGLCHGDLKSNNIAVKYTENGPRVTILDVGLMEEFGFNPNWAHLKIRKPIYAPELYRGSPFSPETQVYQMANVLDEILDIFDSFPESYFSFITMLIPATGEPENRPQVTEILECVEELYREVCPNIQVVTEEKEKEEEEEKENSSKRKRTEDEDREDSEMPLKRKKMRTV